MLLYGHTEFGMLEHKVSEGTVVYIGEIVLLYGHTESGMWEHEVSEGTGELST